MARVSEHEDGLEEIAHSTERGREKKNIASRTCGTISKGLNICTCNPRMREKRE